MTRSELLAFVARYGSILFDKYHFRVAHVSDSGYDSNFEIMLSAGAVDVGFYIDRDGYSTGVSFSNRLRTDGADVALMREMLTGEQDAGELNSDTGAFLESHWIEIIEMFSEARIDETLRKADALRHARAKRLWGDMPDTVKLWPEPEQDDPQ